MNGQSAILLFLALNSGVAAGMGVWLFVRTKILHLEYVVPALLVPGFGFILCGIMAYRFKKGKYSLEAGEIVGKMKIESQEYVDNERLERTVPANDAMDLSTDQDRRKYLLGLLRQHDMASLRPVMLKAIHNSDSEATHYAATAITELQRTSYNAMYEAGKNWTGGPEGTVQAARDYAMTILLYLENSELDGMKNYSFRQRYEEVMTDMFRYHRRFCTGDDYGNLVRFYIQQGRLDEAKQYAEEWVETFPAGEDANLLPMQIAWISQDAEYFNFSLRRLLGSRVELSSDGLALVRFWTQKVQRPAPEPAEAAAPGEASP